MEARIADLESRLARAEEALAAWAQRQAVADAGAATAERKARIAAGGTAFMLICGLAAFGAAPGESAVRGTKLRAPFSVVDRHGHDLFRIDATPGGGQLLLLDGGGKHILAAYNATGGRGFTVSDGAGTNIGGITSSIVSGGEVRAITLFDGAGVQVSRMVAGAGPFGGTIRGFSVSNTAGIPVVKIGPDPGDGGTRIAVTDRAGNDYNAVRIGFNPGLLGMTISDPAGGTAGTPAARIGMATGDGTRHVDVFNRSGGLAGTFASDAGDGGTLALFDKNGTLLFGRP